MTLGIGLNLVPGGKPTDSVFRIGHMGHLNPHALLGTLACIETGLKALGTAEPGEGVQAAMQVIASSHSE